MKILTPGHKYELDNFNGSPNKQTIQFIEKEKMVDGGLTTVNDGTTNEEVLAILINRIQYLNGMFPCRENSIVITKLEEALMWLEKRTKDRVKRGVEGKAEK